MNFVPRRPLGIFLLVTLPLASCGEQDDAAEPAESSSPASSGESAALGEHQLRLASIVNCPLNPGEYYYRHRHWFRNYRNPNDIAIWAGRSRLVVKAGVMPGTGLLDYNVAQSGHNRAVVEFSLNHDAPATNQPTQGGGRYVLRIHYGPCAVDPETVVRVDDGETFPYKRRSPGHWIEVEVDELSTYAAAAPSLMLPEVIPPDTVTDPYVNADTTAGERLEPPR